MVDRFGPLLYSRVGMVAGGVRRAAQAIIDAEGVFMVTGDTGAFVCR